MPQQSTLPKPLRLFTLLSISLTIASLLFALIARALGYGLPYTFAYFLPGNMFNDFNGFSLKMSLYGTPDFFTFHGGYFMYPAPMVFLFKLLLSLPLTRHASVHFTAPATLLIAFFLYQLNRQLSRSALASGTRILLISTIVLTSYPLLFDLQRANLKSPPGPSRPSGSGSSTVVDPFSRPSSSPSPSLLSSTPSSCSPLPPRQTVPRLRPRLAHRLRHLPRLLRRSRTDDRRCLRLELQQSRPVRVFLRRQNRRPGV